MVQTVPKKKMTKKTHHGIPPTANPKKRTAQQSGIAGHVESHGTMGTPAKRATAGKKDM